MIEKIFVEISAKLRTIGVGILGGWAEDDNARVLFVRDVKYEPVHCELTFHTTEQNGNIIWMVSNRPDQDTTFAQAADILADTMTEKEFGGAGPCGKPLEGRILN